MTICARPVSPSAAMFWRSVARAVRLFSMKTASAAPRDRASRPKAPVPAKASSTRAPAYSGPAAARAPCVRMLNKASRARSLVGRTMSPCGAASGRPRCLPAMMRMAALRGPPLLVAGAELLGEHLARHFLDLAARQDAELERAVGQPDEPRHGIAKMLEDAADLGVGAPAQPPFDPGNAAL